MDERALLDAGLIGIRPLLEAPGFVVDASGGGVSSGGPFATAVFQRGPLEVGLIVRGGMGLGCPNYSVGGGYIGHPELVWALGRAGEERLVEGEWLSYWARNGGDAFEALRRDLEGIILPALDASESRFRAALAAARDRLWETRGWLTGWRQPNDRCNWRAIFGLRALRPRSYFARSQLNLGVRRLRAFGMGKFRVLVHGRGLVVRRFWFWRRRLGFYTTCYVEAEDAAAAGARAIEFLRGEPKLVLAALEVPAMEVEEVEEVPSSDDYPYPPTGFVFYPAATADSPRPVA